MIMPNQAFRNMLCRHMKCTVSLSHSLASQGPFAPFAPHTPTYVSYRNSRKNDRQSAFAAFAAFAAAVTGLSCITVPSSILCEDATAPAPTKNILNTPGPAPGQFQPTLPLYRLTEVAAHRTIENQIWVTYDHGVYDITTFMMSHPGGADKIKLAAGGSIVPFWKLYAAHHHVEVYELLEQYRIGNVHPEDYVAVNAQKNVPDEGPYAHEPERSAALRINSTTPFNAEPPEALLVEKFITPNALFFVRNHLPVPADVDLERYRLEIEHEGRVLSLTLDELKANFDHHSIVSTIQCAGNRRSEMSEVKKVNGLSWDKTAIATAKWTGVRLADVLRFMDVREEDHEKDRHVHFEGMDKGVDGVGYGASIPLSTATDPRKDVLLAFDMNDEPIPRDHGFPLRAIVPGTVGARQVKFLDKIKIASVESPSFWQQQDYKGFPPNTDYSTENYKSHAGPSIQELPVQSAITEPSHGSVFRVASSDDECLTLRGYAWSGGGRGIVRVDVSLDGGKSWKTADLSCEGTSQRINRAWAWTPWELTIDSHDLGEGTLDIQCKAVDSSYNNQPDTIAPIWNMRGVLNNAWHHIQIQVEK